MGGLVKELTLETDSREQLVLGLQILLRWHRTATHYRTGVDMNKVPYLILMWGEGSSKRGTPLMAPMKEPGPIADQLLAWLGTAEYGRAPNTDGDAIKGYLLTNKGPVTSITVHDPAEHGGTAKRLEWPNYDHTGYDFCTIQPKYIVYGK